MRFALLLAPLAALAAGCGPDCRTSCEKLYGDADGECNINRPGYEGDAGAQELTQRCEADCESAMTKAGELEGYDPNRKASSNEDISLQNEKQAALWMECVEETSCENLQNGYCEPVP